MTETKPLPTIKDIELHDKISIFDYAERINKVLLVHEQHAKEMLDGSNLSGDCFEQEYWRGRLEAVQSLRGTNEKI